MRFTWVLVGVMGLAGIGTAAETCTVGVRIHNLFIAPPGALFQAKSMAGEMFGRIGVQVQWQGGGVRETGKACWPPIEIYLEAGSPGADRPDSMAYTMPYREGGARIYVFVDRVAAMVPPGRVGTVAWACAGTRNHARAAGREPPLRAGSDEGALGHPRFPRHGGASATFRRPGRPINTCRHQATQGQHPHVHGGVMRDGLI